MMTVVTSIRFTGAYFAAFIGSFSMKAANYRPKLVTVNLNANALPQ